MISQPQHSPQPPAALLSGSRDGLGAADHDQPYRFGVFGKPRVSAPYPFTTRQYSRLLVLRGRVQDGLLGVDDVAA